MQLVSRANHRLLNAGPALSRCRVVSAHCRGAERPDPDLRPGDEQSAAGFKDNRNRLRFDLDDAVAPAHLERDPGSSAASRRIGRE